MNRSVYILAAALLFPQPVYAQETPEPVELSILYSGEDVTWVASMEELCEEFMLQNPDIVIYTENSALANCEEELKVKEALGEFPDIFELENIGLFAEAGRLGAFGEAVSSLVSSPIEADGEVYGLPTYAVTNGVIYNKEIFKNFGLSAPGNYEEFLQICEILKANGVTPLALGGNSEEFMLYWLNYFFQKEVIAEIPDWQEQRRAGKVSFTDEAPMRMLEEFEWLMTSGYILEESVIMTENQLAVRMVKDEFAMIYAGPWLFSKIVDAYPEAVSSDRTNMGEAIPPEEDPVTYRIDWFFIGEEDGSVTALTQNNSYWAISQECAADQEKYEAAEKFLQFFYKKENYRETLLGLYGLPVTKEAIIYPGAPMHQGLMTDYRYAKKSLEYLGSGGMGSDFLYTVNEIMLELYEGIITVEEAAYQMDEAWDATF